MTPDQVNASLASLIERTRFVMLDAYALETHLSSGAALHAVAEAETNLRNAQRDLEAAQRHEAAKPRDWVTAP